MILKRAWIVLIIFITPDSWKSKIFKIVLKKVGMDTAINPISHGLGFMRFYMAHGYHNHPLPLIFNADFKDKIV